MTRELYGENYFDVQLWTEGIPSIGSNAVQTLEQFCWPTWERDYDHQPLGCPTSTDTNDSMGTHERPEMTGRSSTDESTSTSEKQPPETRRAKRLAQNRAAQRAFRARRENRMSELQDEVSDLSKKLEHLEVDNKRLTDNLRDAQTEIRSLRSLVPGALVSQYSERCRGISLSQDGVSNVVLLKLDLNQIKPEARQTGLEHGFVLTPGIGVSENE